MRYPGGKGGAGVYQAIINQLPPHRVYIEPFVGGGNIFERKAPAASSVLADLEPAVVAHWREACIGRFDVEVHQADALELLEGRSWQGDELVYLDPPYVHSTRRSLDLYTHELDDAAHARLLELAAAIPAMVAISGYRCALYDQALAGWRRVDFRAMSRGGVRTESLWMNYPAPAVIADLRYVGRDFRERERIKRKAARWVRRFEQLPALERAAIVAQLEARGICSPPPARVDRPSPGASSGDGPTSTIVAHGAAAAPAARAMEYST